jgi:hypothetical protein
MDAIFCTRFMGHGLPTCRESGGQAGGVGDRGPDSTYPGNPLAAAELAAMRCASWLLGNGHRRRQRQ